MKKSILGNMDRETRGLMLRLFVLTEEIDILQDTVNFDINKSEIQSCIKVLQFQIDKIKTQLRQTK